MEKNQKMLETAKYPELVCRLCLPSIIIMLVMVVYNMADTFFIGRTGDANSLAALSLSGPVFSILLGLGTLFGNGGCTAISLALGRKDYHAIESYTTLCFYGAMAIGVLLLVAMGVALRLIALGLGADDATITYTMQYLRIIEIGAPIILFNNVFSNIIRADGAATESMICNLLGTFVNIGLDALFILVLKWGVTGAAAATVIGNAVSVVYLLYYIFRKNPSLRFHPARLSLKKEIVVPVVTLGVPMACSTLLMSISSIIANNLMMDYSSTALAAQGVAGKVGMLISMLMMGLCMGLQPAFSYSFSANQKKRLSSIIRNTAILTVVLGTILTAVCFCLRNQLIMIFINDEEVLAYGQVMVIAAIAIGPFYGIYQLCQTFLQSTGKASYAIAVSLLDKGIVYIPMLFLMNACFGAYGIAFASPVTLVFSIAAAVVLSLRWSRRCG